MQKMRVAEAAERQNPTMLGERATYKGYGGFEVELRPTGHPRAALTRVLPGFESALKAL